MRDTNKIKPGHTAGFFALRAIGIAVYTSIYISVNVFVFYVASCVFGYPKNLLAHTAGAVRGWSACATWSFLTPGLPIGVRRQTKVNQGLWSVSGLK